MITIEYLYSTICISCNSEHFLLSDCQLLNNDAFCFIPGTRWDWYIVTTSKIQCIVSINSPCVAPLAETPSREAYGLADQSTKKPILVFLSLFKLFLKVLRLVPPTVCWSNLFHLFTTLLEKKCFQQSRVHLTLVSLSEWPLVPLLFFSNINKSWSPIIHFPWDILKTIKSCLFILSSKDHKLWHLYLCL